MEFLLKKNETNKRFIFYKLQLRFIAKWVNVLCALYAEKFKEDIMADEFRQDLLRRTSAQTLNIDESKRPAFQPVNESFRKLAVDWPLMIANPYNYIRHLAVFLDSKWPLT